MDPIFYHSLVDGDFSGGNILRQQLVDGDFWTLYEDHGHVVYTGIGDTIDYTTPLAIMDDADTTVTITGPQISATLSDTDALLYMSFNGDFLDTNWIDHSQAGNNPTGNTGFFGVQDFRAKFGTSAVSATDNNAISFSGTTDWGSGTGDYTISAWLYIVTFEADILIWRHHRITSDTNRFFVNFASNTLRFRHDSGFLFISDPATWTLNVWHHVAITRSGNDWSLYLNGTRIGNTTDSTFIGSPDATPTIGNATVLQDWILDDVIITKRALWTGASFSVPTTSYGFDDRLTTPYQRVSYSLFGNDSEGSDITRVVVDASGILAGPVGNQPQGEVLTPILGAKFRLTWLYNSDNQPAVPTGYKIYSRVSAGGTFALATTVAHNARRSRYSFTTDALSDGVQYDYQVRTYRTISSVDIEQANGTVVTGIADSTGPPAVTGLTVE